MPGFVWLTQKDGLTAVDATNPLPVTNAGTGTSSQQVQGTAATGAVPSGNPVLEGMVVSVSAPTYTAGVAPLSGGLKGGLFTTAVDPGVGTLAGVQTFASTGLTNATSGVVSISRTYLTNGTTSDAATNIAGAIAGGSAGTGVAATAEAGAAFVNLTALGTSAAIKTGSGILHKVIINTKGTTANTLKLYASLTATGTVIATIDTTSNVGSMIYDLAFTTGLTAVLATGTSADVTLVYR